MNPPNRYTAVLDLTTRAQQKAKTDEAVAAFSGAGPDLAEAVIESLPPVIRRAVENAGWKSLMPVQSRAIPYMLERQDLIVQSRTGSGKTGAFLLPMFELLDETRAEVQALVLTPTRELARQIYEEFERMRGASGKTGLQAALVYGGVNYAQQNTALRAGSQLVIGTPGRILDHLERRTFTLNHLSILVLDEADEMLSMGFYPAMREMNRYLPRHRSSYMYSATMPPRVRLLAREFLKEPGFLSLSGGHMTVQELEHRYHLVDRMEKDRALARIIEMENPESAIVFVNTKKDVEYVTTFLQNYGYDAAAISGDLSQKDRERVMDRIRNGRLRFLVATDVAARGIDISDLSHVLMYDVPQDAEYYVHRSGRTARAGKTGVAISLVGQSEESQIRSIAVRYGIELQKLPIPTQEDVEARASESMTGVLEDMYRERTNLQKERIGRFLPLARELALEEPELLSMLLDDLYVSRIHVPPVTPEVMNEPELPNETAPREKGSKKRKSPKKQRSDVPDDRNESDQISGTE